MNYVILLLVILSLIELIPFTLASVFGINYGASNIGKIHQYLNAKIMLAYISWLAFDIMILLLIFRLWRSANAKALKVAITLCILALVYSLVYPILQIANLVLYFTSHNGPFIYGDEKVNRFPHSAVLEHHCSTIQNEFSTNYKGVNCIHDNIPGFQISTPDGEDKCWRTIVLKRQGEILETARKSFPQTCKLINDSSIHNAIFSILDANVNIPPHTGYYKGYLRYHLGIEIPKVNGKSPFITCGGQTYHWKNCEGVLFDDMYLHYVENNTNKRRVVLYLDVLRNDVPRVLQPFYLLINKFIETHLILRKLIKVQHEAQKQVDVR